MVGINEKNLSANITPIYSWPCPVTPLAMKKAKSLTLHSYTGVIWLQSKSGYTSKRFDLKSQEAKNQDGHQTHVKIL